jgi:hypothetical protein
MARKNRPRRESLVWLRFIMARTAERKSRIEVSSPGKAGAAEAIDIAVKNLIDGLIVPYLVEEFIRLYGPAAVAKMNENNLKSQPDSELNSTP